MINIKDFRTQNWQEIHSVAKMLKKRGRSLWEQVLSADDKREEQVGENVSFVINQNMNFTPYCINSCRFCAYHKRPPRRKTLSEEEYQQLLDNIKVETIKAVEEGCTEVCIQGGLDPRLNYGFYIDILRTVRAVSSTIHIHAFSPEEIAYMSKLSGNSIEDIFKDLKNHGLGSFPGTAAEILVDKVRAIICPEKITTAEWIDIVTTGHSLGIKSSATMMYGHIESELDQAEHIVLLKKIQEITEGFTEFVPLPFVHNNTVLYRKMGARPGSTGMEDVALFSTARLYLGEKIPNLQVSWVKLGPKFAQASLNFGVNDLGGTLFVENISKSAGARYGTVLSPEEMIKLIRDAGRKPVQRDTVYNILRTFDD